MKDENAELRATGMLLAKAGESLLRVAEAEERDDQDEVLRVGNEFVQVLVAATALAYKLNKINVTVEDAWRAMGRQSGWDQSPPPTPEEEQQIRREIAVFDRLVRAARAYRDATHWKQPAVTALEDLQAAAIAYGKDACSICLRPFGCTDPDCPADSHTHAACAATRKN